MQVSDMLTPEQLNTLYAIAKKYNVDPNIILAIGWHETHWGRLGDGRLGMFTGYGSYDNGSDYGYSGFEKQVTGTAKKMSAWGMKPGSASYAKLQAGQAGQLPTGIYATSSTWASSVWNIYKSIGGTGGAGGAADEVTIVESVPKNQTALDKAKALYLSLTGQKTNSPWYLKAWNKGSQNKYNESNQELDAEGNVKDDLGGIIGYLTMGVLILLVVGIGLTSFFKAFAVSPTAIPDIKSIKSVTDG